MKGVLFMKKITAVITALFILLAASSCDPAVTPVPGSTAPAETGSVTKPADTEKATEAQTEAATEKATEAQTEAPTEKVTEAPTERVTETPTEPVTEIPTEPVTEQGTAYPPDEYDSVLVKEKYYNSEGVLMHEYVYENGLRMKDLYFYGDGTPMSSIEYIYLADGRLMGSVTYNPNGSVSESTEVTYDVLEEGNGITTHVTTTRSYNDEHKPTVIFEESLSYKKGVLLYGTDVDTYLKYVPENDAYLEDTSYATQYTYEYDNEGLLAKETVDSSGMKTVTTYSYDYEGTLIRLDRTPEGLDIKPTYQIYEYADGGLLLKMTMYEIDGSVRNYTLYDYNQFYQVKKATVYGAGGEIDGYTEYEYKLVHVG
jgi:hypothetical protein